MSCASGYRLLSMYIMDNWSLITLHLYFSSNYILVNVRSLSLRLRLITLTTTLIIPDITKTSSTNCLLTAFVFIFS